MSHVRQEIRIAAPIEQVFKLACDLGRASEWNPYLELSNVSGPIDKVGTTFEGSLKLLGQVLKSKGSITEVEPQRLIHIHTTNDEGGTADWVYKFVPSGDDTVCTLDIEYTVSGLIAGTLDRFVYHAALERATRHMGENFAALAEVKVPQPA